MVMPKPAYEESRQKRIEECKKRMEEMNIKKLSQSLHKPKPSPMKKAKPRVPRQHVDPTPVRRSSRVADLPTPSYKEVPIEPMGRARSYRSGHGRRNNSDRIYASDEDREMAKQQAEELQSGLDQDIPSFVKSMSHSHVTLGFWLGLPVDFCQDHLPTCDVFIKLVDENEDEHEAKYLHYKKGLSAGWRGFALDHELEDGDALVFQLIEPTTFKVYIIRVNDNGDGSA